MTTEEKLRLIRDMCDHPGSYHWKGRDLARVIRRVIDTDEPIPFTLSDIDQPIQFELVHDAVYEGVDSDPA